MEQQQPELRQSHSSKMYTCSATATRCNASVVGVAAVLIAFWPRWSMGPGGTVHAPSAHATAMRPTRFVVVSVCVVAGVLVVVGVSVATVVVLVSPVVILCVCVCVCVCVNEIARHIDVTFRTVSRTDLLHTFFCTALSKTETEILSQHVNSIPGDSFSVESHGLSTTNNTQSVSTFFLPLSS